MSKKAQKALKKVDKLLGQSVKPLSKAKIIDALCDDIENMSEEMLLQSAKEWRRSVLKRRSVAELRETYKEEIIDQPLDQES